MKNNSMLLFMIFMILGVIFSLSSNNWILIWCGLEIVLVCFIPMMLNNKLISSECCVKYFIVQSLSSSIFMLSMMMLFMNLNLGMELMVNISLMIKMGVAPFHNWVLNVVSGMNFSMVFFMLTLLKLPPLVILSYLNLYLIPFIIITLMVGSLFGLNQNSSFKIIVYSSIFNMGFILPSIHFNDIWLIYLFFYSLMIFMLMIILNIHKMFYINQILINSYSPYCNFVIFMNMLSMGGMPPLLGFLIKLIVLELVLYMNFYFLSMIMIMFSLFVMYFYVRLSFLSMMIYSSIFKFYLYNTMSMFLMTLVFNLLSFPLFILMKFYL
nr:NADH dehydrogenase subunit 2 [Jacobiasca formosana]UER93867.1 NADH dehydrogenase subunit 2 [Jacobiasca formosana]